MFSQPPVITDMGVTLLLRAANGVKVAFTKFQAGKGFLDPGEDPKSVTALKSVAVDDIGITAATGTEEQGYIQIEGKFDNQNDVSEDFLWTELGLWAQIDDEGEDDDGTEYLYAYGYDAEHAEMIRAGGGSTVVEQSFSAIIAIGESENITANVLPAAEYASKAAFEAHLGDHSNPHQVTVQQIGAAAASHNHSAANITSGTLPLGRGGTGVTTLQALRELIGAPYDIGYFDGDGTKKRAIDLGYKPSQVVLFRLYKGDYWPPNNYQATDNERRLAGFCCAFKEGENYYHDGCNANPYATCDADTLLDHGHGGAAVTANGFAVGNYGASGANTSAINTAGFGYLYIAFK